MRTLFRDVRRPCKARFKVLALSKTTTVTLVAYYIANWPIPPCLMLRPQRLLQDKMGNTKRCVGSFSGGSEGNQHDVKVV